MQTALPPQPLKPDLEGIKLKRFKLDILLREKPEMWPVIYDRCKRDFFFWAEMFCFAWSEYSPGEYKVIPLALYDFQRDMASEIIENVFRVIDDPNARWNAAADKARKMAATFTALLVAQWLAQFHGISTVITTKDKNDVDIPGNINTPFERLRFQMLLQPRELLPPSFSFSNKTQYKSKLINFGNNGQLTGMAPTGNAMRQARALIWIADEFAFAPNAMSAWEGSSGTVKIRIALSTPNGTSCLFHLLIYPDDWEDQNEVIPCHVFELDWWKHPDYAEGIYRKPDGTLSSPYMDSIQANEKASVVAKEYLRDHGESTGGKIYPTFRKDACVVNNLSPDRATKTLYRSWDPGPHFAVGIGHKDEDDRLLCVKEFYLDRKMVPSSTTVLRAMAEKVIAWTDANYQGWDIVDIGDPYGHQINGADQSDSDFHTLFKLHGIRVQSVFFKHMHTHIRRTKGIEIMNEIMITNVQLDDGTWSPQLLIDASCKITIRAFHDKYRYVVLKDGTVTEEIARNHPANDIADVWRYLVLKLFYKPGRDESNKPKKQKPERVQWNKSQPSSWRLSERRYG